MQRQFLEFIKVLARALGRDNILDIVDIYEVGMHWDALQNLYTSKIEAIDHAEERRKEEQRKQAAETNTLETLFELDPSLVSSIAERRENRTRPIVMVADDDQMSRTLAGNVLRESYDMAFAKNGAEALKEFVASAPDILFLDIGMPDIGGHEVLESIFQMDPDAYVIMFSGRKDKETIMTSLELGAKGFLGKPFTREELYAHAGGSPHIQSKESQAA